MASDKLRKRGRDCEERTDKTQLGEGRGGGIVTVQRESWKALEPVRYGVEEEG